MSINTNKRVAAVIYAVMIMLVTTTVAIGVYDFNIKTGSITVGAETKEVTSRGTIVADLLEEQEITLEEEDYISASTDSELEDKFDIKIRRAVPVVLNFKDQEVEIETAELTVKDVLKSLSVFYDEDDKITPALDTPIAEDMKITVVQYQSKEKIVDEQINFAVEKRDDPSIEKGQTVVSQEGIKGLRQNKIKQTFENGKLIKTQMLETKLVREPVREITQVGTKVIQAPIVTENAVASVKPVAPEAKPEAKPAQDTAKPAPQEAPAQEAPAQPETPAQPAPAPEAQAPKPAPQNGKPSLEGKRSMVMKASAYDLSFASCGKNPGDKYYGITATGTKARPGVVAVDPKVIPLGSKLYIESMDGTGSYGMASAEDKGGAIKGNRIDLFYQNRSDALQFGRRDVKVYILD